MKVLKVIGAIALGLVGLALLLYVIGVVVNWRDQPPSPAAQEIRKIQADRAPVADADNGFIYALGFGVPASEDPQHAGALRKAWLEALNLKPELLDADPMKERDGFSPARSRALERVGKACGAAQSVACRDAFLAASLQPRMGLEELQLARYRELLRRSSWREVIPIDGRAPLPAYGDIIGGQQLLFLDLAARAKSAPPAEIAAALREDLAFWRSTQNSADYLISKMIAVAAIRQHFFFGNLVLREVPGAQAEVIEAWSVPFSAEELSMRRTMAGELSYAEGVMLRWQNGSDESLIETDEPGLTLRGRIASSLARPFYQHQDQMNYYAALYLDFARRFEAPLPQYAHIAKSIEAAQPETISFHVYNAVGHVFRGLAGTWSYVDYPSRVGSIEGMRRAALLTAQLRERGVPLDQMPQEVSGAGLRNPFNGKAFEWNAEEQAVLFVGPHAESSRRQHSYFH